MKTPNYTKSFVKKAIRKYGKKLKIIATPTPLPGYGFQAGPAPRQRRVSKAGKCRFSVDLRRRAASLSESCFQYDADMVKRNSVKTLVDTMFAYDDRRGLKITQLLVGDKLLQREPYTIKAKTKKKGRK